MASQSQGSAPSWREAWPLGFPLGRAFSLLGRAGFLLGCTFVLLGCAEEKASAPAQPVALAPARPRPIDQALLTRALRALEPKLPRDAAFLEIRVEPGQMEIQVISDQAVTSHRYRESQAQGGAQLGAPVGTVDPPVQVPVYGNGKLAENGFSSGEVDLHGIAASFPIAVKAVDPADGWVERLVVRRYFPFGKAVRARIYVHSPRMSGSIDTNGNGIPLRKGRL